MDRLEDFRALGFQMESFGPGSFLVRTVPLFARRINHEDLLRDIVDEMAGSEFGRKVQFHRERIAASMACRAAVKAGDMLSMPEMAAIVDGLRGTDTAPEIPTNCPHGRPTTIHLPLAQIERLFRRT
jgi:DNA mismatch repair protein MutL